MYPASDKLIRKYSKQDLYSVRETPEVYTKITKPFIEALDKSDVQWMHNILENKKEQELCQFENEHFKL